MSDTGRQSPLGINQLGSYLNNEGLTVNPTFTEYVGTSRSFTEYNFGSICNGTVLRLLTYAINVAYSSPINETTYNNLITIGSSVNSVNGTITATDNYFDINVGNLSYFSKNTYIIINNANPNYYNGTWLIDSISISSGSYSLRIISTSNYGNGTCTVLYDSQIPALGNSKPNSYTWDKPNGKYGVTPTLDSQGWGGNQYRYGNPATQWGFLKLLSLQSWQEWNYNNTQLDGTDDNPAGYRDFISSFMQGQSWIEDSNKSILAVDNSAKFLDGVYSNMDDLITSDITNVCKSTMEFGQDLINLGKVLDLTSISTFGLPSNLLRTLSKYKALTQNIILAIIAAGIEYTDLQQILEGQEPSNDQEKKLYNAFLTVTGTSLIEIFTYLNFNSQENKTINDLADFLNVAKLFPNSYTAFTVPVYNNKLGLPTNSKTYYKIYSSIAKNKNDYSINSQLNNPNIKKQIGSKVIPKPHSYGNTFNNDKLIINTPPIGFGSYLSGILPEEMAVACGAFATAMGQIKNINNVPIEKFAQVVRNIETTYDSKTKRSLNINGDPGTAIPTSLTLRNKAKNKIALGSGPQQSYTMSDLFGCTSGLTYNDSLQTIKNQILSVQTANLFNIYHQLYLACDWKQPTSVAVLTTSYVQTSAYDPITFTPAQYNLLYRIVGVTITDPGGGYSRENAPNPTIAFADGSGTTGTTQIGKDDTNLSTFGRIISTSITPGSPVVYATASASDGVSGPPVVTPPPTVVPQIQSPPIGMSGTNSPYNTLGWPTLNTVIQNYINQANTEIKTIKNNNLTVANSLNQAWESLGYHLTIEQRARTTCFRPPLATTRDNYLSTYPSIIYSFIDMMPQFAKSTEPNMYAQTIEAITDNNSVGGQSAVGHMRESRNQERLNQAGLSLDNSIPNSINGKDQAALIANNKSPNSLGTYNPITNEFVPFNSQGGVPVYNGTAMNPKYYPTLTNNVATIGSNIYNGIAPGTFVDTPYANIITPNLNTLFTSSTLSPSSYPVNDAIEEVIRCNCDCWDL